MTTDDACALCKSQVPANALSMSPDGAGMICYSCGLAVGASQRKAGGRQAYFRGAVIVGLTLLAFILFAGIRILQSR